MCLRITIRNWGVLLAAATNSAAGHRQLSHSYEESLRQGCTDELRFTCSMKCSSGAVNTWFSSLIMFQFMQELKQLADELRSDVIFHVSKTGGHLGSSLGVVELTVALHYVFNAPQDKILWDVGHQVLSLYLIPVLWCVY